MGEVCLAAGALKDNSRHNSVTYAKKISSSLGFSQDEKANFKKCFFFRYNLFIYLKNFTEHDGYEILS